MAATQACSDTIPATPRRANGHGIAIRMAVPCLSKRARYCRGPLLKRGREVAAPATLFRQPLARLNRSSAACQFTTFQNAATYSGRRFWYLR